jgi:rhodanese-related sulfurtransferase
MLGFELKSKRFSTRMSIIQITVQELATRLASDRSDDQPALQLIDVRERDEVEIAAIAGFEILPLSEYAEWEVSFKQKFDPHAETLVLCHHGMRSGQMCQWLVNQGFTNVKNIGGGIDAYAYAIEPSMAKY